MKQARNVAIRFPSELDLEVENVERLSALIN
jgi:hypothetical protein